MNLKVPSYPGGRGRKDPLAFGSSQKTTPDRRWFGDGWTMLNPVPDDVTKPGTDRPQLRKGLSLIEKIACFHGPPKRRPAGAPKGSLLVVRPALLFSSEAQELAELAI